MSEQSGSGRASRNGDLGHKLEDEWTSIKGRKEKKAFYLKGLYEGRFGVGMDIMYLGNKKQSSVTGLEYLIRCEKAKC